MAVRPTNTASDDATKAETRVKRPKAPAPASRVRAVRPRLSKAKTSAKTKPATEAKPAPQTARKTKITTTKKSSTAKAKASVTTSAAPPPTDDAPDTPPAAGPLLIARVANAIERELTQIEIIIGNNRVPPRARSEAERRARTLASLARTLAVVTQLRAKNLQSLADDSDDDAMPRDLDDLRETLARRLEQLLAEEPEPVAGEPDAR